MQHNLALYKNMTGVLRGDLYRSDIIVEKLLNELGSRKIAKKVINRLQAVDELCRIVVTIPSSAKEYQAALIRRDQVQKWQNTVKSCAVGRTIKTHVTTSIHSRLKRASQEHTMPILQKSSYAPSRSPKNPVPPGKRAEPKQDSVTILYTGNNERWLVPFDDEKRFIAEMIDEGIDVRDEAGIYDREELFGYLRLEPRPCYLAAF